MRNTNKKGFTIVELVIVVAVIAILAAVLIPTFAGIINKANESKDTQLIKNLNTALAANVDGEKTMANAVAAAAEFGYDIDKINASATDNEILWDSVNNVFCYLNGGAIEYIDGSEYEVADADYWVIDDVINAKYSTYLVNNTDATVVAVNGLDVTACGATNVIYEGNGTVSIFTNGGNLTVNSGNVTHYGAGYILTLADSAKANYVEKGTFAANKSEIKTPSAASDTVAEVESKEELTEALANAEIKEIVLTKDIAVEATSTVTDFVVAADRTVEINLNGHKITSVHNFTSSTGAGNNGLLKVKGNLTISGEGSIEFTQTGNNFGWNASAYVIAVEQGELTINAGVKVINHGGTDMAYAIDVLTNGNGGDATLTINTAFVESTYRAIRGFCNSTTNTVYITVNGGIVRSTNNNAIWMQSPSDKVNLGVLKITGGSIESNGYVGGEDRIPITFASSGCDTSGLTKEITGGQLLQNGKDVTANYK